MRFDLKIDPRKQNIMNFDIKYFTSLSHTFSLITSLHFRISPAWH